MEETYDVIVLGTGLTECILSGVLSVEGKKVLHMDRNDYYGGDSASLNLTQLFKKYKGGATPPEKLGKDRDYNIDIVPKFMMAAEDLVNILVHTDVTRYLEFKQISGSYVFRDGKIAKVPATETEAVSSPLMGMFEKYRAKGFFSFVQQYDLANNKTWQGVDAEKTPMSEVFKKFGLEPGTQDFIGHAMCLFLDDTYKSRPFLESLKAMQLYTQSLARYGKSPYIYPRYGLGELPQGFARLSAIYGGTYMLDKPIDEIVIEDGKVVGVKAGGEIAKCANVICDPSYVSNKKKVGSIIRCMCLLRHPIPNTSDADSVQLILPLNQINRKNDIYVACVSSAHNVVPSGMWLAIVSTMLEGNGSNPETEIQAALKLLGPIEEKVSYVSDMYEPVDDGRASHVFVSKSYDATSHFQSVSADVRDIYKRVTGNDLVLKKREPMEDNVE